MGHLAQIMLLLFLISQREVLLYVTCYKPCWHETLVTNPSDVCVYSYYSVIFLLYMDILYIKLKKNIWAI